MPAASSTAVIQRSLKAIVFLKGGRRTIKEISDNIGVGRRQVNRYLQVLSNPELGIPLQSYDSKVDFTQDNEEKGTKVFWIDRRWNL